MTGGKPKSKLRRWLKRIGLTLLGLILVLVFGVLPYLFAVLVTNAGTRPRDRELTSTPSDFGLEHIDVEYVTRDSVKIRGWLVPSRNNAVIIYSHGLFRSRRELLERAAALSRLGYGALIYDERNHGESGKARTSLGYLERLDALAGIDFLRTDRQFKGRIILMGVSMGATAVLLAAAESPEVSGVVADSAFLSLEDTIDHHVKLFFKIPPFPIANEIQFFIEARAGFDGSSLNSIEAVRRMGQRPALFIAGEHDRRIPPDIARQLYEASESQARDLLIIDGPETRIHGHAYSAAPELYIERVSRFLDAIRPD